MDPDPQSRFPAIPEAVRPLVESARERFRTAWEEKATRPSIRSFVEGLEGEERATVLSELLVLEVELRRDAGEDPSLTEYLARFPDDEFVVVAAYPPAETGRSLDNPTIQDPVISRPPTESAGDDPATSAPYRDPEVSEVHGQWQHMPDRLGRYKVLRPIGSGNFGRVFLARDEALDRNVAIKVPLDPALGESKRMETILAEGRLAAKLRHPAIISVFDVARSKDGFLFIVLEYAEGTDLRALFGKGGIEPARAAGLLAAAAEGVHYAHTAGLVHRDLKPENIILDREGRPRVTDFGIALSEYPQSGRAGEIAGTPHYMAPEQVRGESHRLDGRTDVWALGVILYEGLTGRRPFEGDRDRLFDEILYREAKPLRQINDSIPLELERICLRCLAKRMADRYSTAKDFADELHAWMTMIEDGLSSLRAGAEGLAMAPCIPKGLHAFEASDSEFFLKLLPGPRGRDGLPESIRFWKTRIDGLGNESSFSVGLFYGPSGGGKSSLVKAGLLPRLESHVRPIYLEASAEGTATRLTKALAAEVPWLPEGCTLAELLGTVRTRKVQSREEKIFIVLDQFEQWLHACPDLAHAELVEALRQADGRRVQVLVLVRDDFWMAVTRFFKALEIPLVEGGNSASVELFDAEHARRVLADFGRAFGRLGPADQGPDPEHNAFLDQAVSQMIGPEAKLEPVRISLFAEMMRRRVWTPDTLDEVGGVAGIGVKFLEESFDSPSAPPSYKIHHEAAMTVLRALLPASGSPLRENVHSETELIEVAAYRDRRNDFRELMRILDSDLRLVTPVDPGLIRDRGDDPSHDPAEVRYQLTHDFLIAPIREWLERRLRSTQTGRARLRLESISTSWTADRSPRHLPSSLEWLSILWHTTSRSWTGDQRLMMRSAASFYTRRLVTILVILAVAWLAWHLPRKREQATTWLEQTLAADFRLLPELVAQFDDHRDLVMDELRRLDGDSARFPRERFVVSLLLFREDPTADRAESLCGRLDDASPDELLLIRNALASHPEWVDTEMLRELLRSDATEPPKVVRVASLLAGLEAMADADWQQVVTPLTRALLAEDDSRTIPRWIELLGSIGPMLTTSLTETCSDLDVDPVTRDLAANTLSGLAGPLDLARAVVTSQPEASLVLLRELERREDRAAAREYLRKFAAKLPGPEADEEEITRIAQSSLGLAILAEPRPLEQALQHRPDPRLRSKVVNIVARLRLAPRLFAGISLERLDPAQRQAIMLSWAETPPDRILPSTIVTEVADRAQALLAADPDPGVHSAASLLLRRWGYPVRPKALRPIEPADGGSPAWMYGVNDHFLVILPGPLEFRMGSPPQEAWRFDYENRHHRRIDRSIAVSATEVTCEQYQQFKSDYQPDQRYVTEAGCPAGGITWYDALRYCNWLSSREGLAPEDWCYPAEVGEDMQFGPEWLERPGFRLPTEAEWEYFTRAGTETTRFFGETETLLSRHARTWLNSGGRSGPVARFLPNRFGLFDTLGSLWEWCQDAPPSPHPYQWHAPYPEGTRENPALDAFQGFPFREGNWQIIRGGAFDVSPQMARCAHRDVFGATSVRYFMGFRVVRTLPR